MRATSVTHDDEVHETYCFTRRAKLPRAPRDLDAGRAARGGEAAEQADRRAVQGRRLPAHGGIRDVLARRLERLEPAHDARLRPTLALAHLLRVQLRRAQ